MKQIINWLQYSWAKLTNLLSTDGRRTIYSENPSDDLPEGMIARPVGKVYYSTPGVGTYWTYINKGRIMKTKYKRPL